MVALPAVDLTVNENGLGLVQTPPDSIVAVIGVCTMGPTGTNPVDKENFVSTPYSFGNLTDFVTARGIGPGVKAASYMHAKTLSSFVFCKVPATARAATKSAVNMSNLDDPTVNPTLTGTPNDSYEVIVEFTLGGVTGTGPITYRYSLDGGLTYTDGISLGVALTLAALATDTGVTVTVVTGKTIVTNDSFTFSTKAASAAVQPITMDFDGASTSVVTITGNPVDHYEVQLEVLTGGTIGTAGIVVRYSLDGGRKFTNPIRLGTDDTLELLEHFLGASATPSTGITVEFAAGDVTAGDVVTFTTTAPEAQDSDIQAAIQALGDSPLGWSFIHVVGQSDHTTAGAVQSELDTLAGAAKYTWAALSARDRGTFELDATWRAALVDDVVDLGASRIAIGAGRRRITDPLTGQRQRRAAMWVVVPKILLGQLHWDPARVASGALSADVEIADDDGIIVEHDARLNPDLNEARYVTLRTYVELSGLYVTLGNMMATPGTDVTLIPLRRVLDLASTVFRTALVRQLVNGVFVNPATYPDVTRRGCIREVDALTIEREAKAPLYDAIIATGYASDVQVSVSRTDPLLTNGGKITVKARVTPVGYLREFIADIGFVDPRLAQLQAA